MPEMLFMQGNPTLKPYMIEIRPILTKSEENLKAIGWNRIA